MKSWPLFLFIFLIGFISFSTQVFASQRLCGIVLDFAPRLIQAVLWCASFISLLVLMLVFKMRQKAYVTKHVDVSLKKFVQHPSFMKTLIVMIIVFIAFMAVAFYSSCKPQMAFVRSYIFAGTMWLAMLQPMWLYFSILKMEKSCIVKSQSLQFYENNRALFDRWSKLLAFAIALFLAVTSLASFYYMDRINWSNCWRAH